MKKPMSACNTREIITELLGIFEAEAASILKSCICMTCMMPFITSQFCEMPKAVVFTVEYSVRSAQAAVYELLKLNRKPPAVYERKSDPRVFKGRFSRFTTFVPRW